MERRQGKLKTGILNRGFLLLDYGKMMGIIKKWKKLKKGVDKIESFVYYNKCA